MTVFSIHNRMPMSRRTLLRGSGALLGLPLLDAMLPTSAAAATPKPPQRVAFLYVPNGIIHDAWKPTSEGRNYALTYSLQPLQDVKEHVNVLSGMSQIPYDQRSGVGHARPTAALLTGKVANKDKVSLGKSVDQIIADAVGGETRLPSLHLSIDGTSLNGNCDSGYSCAYSSCISWRDERKPVPNDNHPVSVFERLFGKETKPLPPQELSKRQAMRRSLLDSVLEDAKRLDRNLGRRDRAKLDEYLYSVRQVERRIQNTQPLVGTDGQPLMKKPEAKPAEFDQHVRLMGDLMTLAFQTDSTRVCTFMFGGAASGRTYPMLGINEGHHQLSHHGNREEKLAALRKIDRFNVNLYAYILKRMQAISEGDGTLLDNSLVYYGSGLGSGAGHVPFDLPVIVGGKGGGAVKTGQHVRYPMDTPLNNLWLTVMRTMGLKLDRFGDSTGVLKELV